MGVKHTDLSTKTLANPSFTDAVQEREPAFRAFLEPDEIVVDNFAGGGGASEGLEQIEVDDLSVVNPVTEAFMRSMRANLSPDIAINHDPEAIAMHKANHPNAEHYIEDVWKVDPVKACRGRRVGLAWFSPTCAHFSKAKGTALDESSVKIRGLCWVAVRWAAAVAPRIILLENVEEFAKFGPLYRRHTDGCSEEYAARAGKRLQKSLAKLRGKSTKKNDRKIAALLKGVSLEHALAGKPVCSSKCKIHKPIKEREGELFRAFISRLERLGYKVEWRLLRACDYGAPTTRRRLFLVARRDGKPIVWPEPTHGPGRAHPFRTAAECIDWSTPCPSIFERDRPLAEKTLARIARGIEKFVLANPKPFIVPPAYGDKGGKDVRVNDIDEPMRTVCGNRGGHAIVTPVLVKAKTYGGGGNDAMPADEPLRTVTASKRGEFAVASATLIRTAHGDVDKNGKRRGLGAHDVEQPLPTVTAGGTDYAIAVPYLVHRSNGERPEKVVNGKVRAAQAPRIYDVEKPLGTVMGQGIKHAVAVAMLIKNNGGNNDAAGSAGQPMDRAMDTISCRDSKSLTVAHLVKMRGTSDAHINASASGADEPVPCVTASGTHVGAVAAFLVKYNRTGTPEALDQPTDTLTTKDRYGLVTVTLNGEEYIVADIGMRMLTPRELYNAQGFPPDYKIDPEYDGKPLTKTAQVRMCGNSVPPVMSRVLARAQLEA